VTFLVALGDGGSVVLTKMAVPDDTRAAGHAAAEAVVGMPTTRQTAVTAFAAAQDASSRQALSVRTKGFTLHGDGRITLTATRTAPTLVLHRIPILRDITIVSWTATVRALPYR